MSRALPFFSVIVPTYQRPEQLRRCLGALVELDYPRDRFEIIVIDDGSPMSPEPVITPFRDRINIKLLTQPNAGPATARNTGAAHARGTFLAFTDDDCTPAPDWLQKLAARLAIVSDYAVVGRTINSLFGNLYSTASQTLIDYLYSYYNADHNKARFFTSNNLAMPTDDFHKVGSFDTTFPRAAGEDRELCDRWLYYGYHVTYVPEAVVYHAHALTLRSFWRQHLNYGRGAFYFHRLCARRSLRRIKIEPPSFYLNLLRYPFSRFQDWRSLPIAALLVVSQVANAIGFFGERLNRTESE